MDRIYDYIRRFRFPKPRFKIRLFSYFLPTLDSGSLASRRNSLRRREAFFKRRNKLREGDIFQPKDNGFGQIIPEEDEQDEFTLNNGRLSLGCCAGGDLGQDVGDWRQIRRSSGIKPYSSSPPIPFSCSSSQEDSSPLSGGVSSSVMTLGTPGTTTSMENTLTSCEDPTDFSDYLDVNNLPFEVLKRRAEILQVLLQRKVLTESEAEFINNCPKDLSLNFPRVQVFNNYLWLPDHLLLGTCFGDYLNYHCENAEGLNKLLTSPISVAYGDAHTFSDEIKDESLVEDLLDENEGKFYSFCLGRAVCLSETNHCARCHACFDHRYWHCENCDRCSLGMSIGTCEHCGFKDVDTSDEDSQLQDDLSVVSVSELQIG